jgi:hypothetical protein
MEKNNKNNSNNTNQQQLFLETKNVKIKSNGKTSTPKAEGGYCNGAIQSGPPTHIQSHQDQNISEKTEVNQIMAWAIEDITEGMWCCMYCRKYLTNNYKKAHELCRQRNPDCRMYVHGCKETNKPEKLSPHE